VSPIGNVGTAEYAVVRSTDLFGPSVAHIVRVDPDGTVTDLPTASSAGLAPALIGAGGDIAAARARRPDEQNYVDQRKVFSPGPPLTTNP
jgi:hypothetical protein